MEEIPSRELRNHTARALKRAQAGATLIVTVHGRPMARLAPLSEQPRRWIQRADLVGRIRSAQADAGLRSDLARLAGETTDDLDPQA